MDLRRAVVELEVVLSGPAVLLQNFDDLQALSRDMIRLLYLDWIRDTHVLLGLVTGVVECVGDLELLSIINGDHAKTKCQEE